ncbi:MAG TPA: ParB/RepB/Spo0J family partition protein [Armatimonadota bacterium]|nr:ParB/RepB/Spo0J family partition protein [Armatimonadota bacterium]
MEKKALGKGLNALFGSNPQTEAAAQAAVIELPLAQITPNPYQPRGEMDPERLSELVESIRTHGILQPLVVRKHDDGYELVAGERRFRASQAAGLAKVPVIVRECTNREMLELALIENIQREDINPMDSAIAFRRLMDEFSLTQEEVATRVGRSRSSVANTLRLLNLPAAIQLKVASGEISEGHARALLSLEAVPEAQKVLLERILKEHLSVRDAERIARGMSEKAQKPEAETKPRDPHLSSVESDLQRHFGTKVTIAGNGNRGVFRIEFYDQEQFERILELLNNQ